jgi:hypothetical protein
VFQDQITQSSLNDVKPSVCTECRGLVVDTHASYSGSSGLKSRPQNQLSCLRVFIVFLSPSSRMQVVVVVVVVVVIVVFAAAVAM